MNKSRTTSDAIEDFSSTLTYIELVAMGTVMIALCAITIIGNALVMISFVMDKKLRTLSNYFLLSLAISDMMIATISMPLFTTYLLIGEWTLGRTVCDVWLAQDAVCCNATCMNLLMIGFDRYFSVTSPLKYRAKKTPRRVGIMIGIVWMVAFLLWPPWIYAWPYIEDHRTVPDDDCYIQFLETNPYITLIIAFFDYYAPVTIMLVLYYKIWRTTKRRARYLANMDSEYQTESMCLPKTDSYKMHLSNPSWGTTFSKNGVSTSNQMNVITYDEANKDTTVSFPEMQRNEGNQAYNDEYNTGMGKFLHSDIVSEVNPKSPRNDTDSNRTSLFKKEKRKHDDKAARMLTAILLAFLVTTTPYNVLVIIYTLDKTHSLIPSYLVNFVCFLFYLNSTLNPLCYALANENFRKTYCKILTCSWSKRSKYTLSSYSDKFSQSKQKFDTKYIASSL